MAGAATVSFYYSIGSRYSYLASTQIETLERDSGCTVRWRPLVSTDLMRDRGADPFERPAGEVAVSGQYEWDYRRRDGEAWAAYYGVPYREPAEGAFAKRQLAEACVLAERHGALVPFSHQLFAAVWADGARVDTAEIARRAEAVGLSGSDLVAGLGRRDVEAVLAATAREARRHGAFGVPSFVVDGTLFWGNDRLVLLRHHLARRSASR